MRTIALYNQEGKRLLTLRQAENKGYGSIEMLKKRIKRGQLPAFKLGSLWLVLGVSLARPKRKGRTTRH